MIYNCHTHTLRSHDSAAELLCICESAAQKNLSGLIVTDHCDCEFAESHDYFRQFTLGEADVARAESVYGGRLQTRFGIELGDPLFNPAFARSICGSFRFDAVLLSVHAVRFPGSDAPFSCIDFGDKTDDSIGEYLSRYFSDVLESVQTFDFDVLAHLTVPLRYIRLKYGRNAASEPFLASIGSILREVIRKDAALEINTSMIGHPGGFFMPDEAIVEMYLESGGRYFTVGSDAHSPGAIDAGLREAHGMLKKYGVKSLCFYKDRQRLTYDI